MAVGARITVATTPTVLIDTTGLSGSGVQGRFLVRNRGTVSVDLGGPAVASGAGYELGAGESVSWDQTLDTAAGDALYGITASGTCRVDALAVKL